MKYELVLKNGKLKFYNRFAFFLALINAALFTMVIFQAQDQTTSTIAIAGAVAIALCLVLFFLESRKTTAQRYRALIALILLSAINWLILQQWLFGITNACLLFLYLVSTRRLGILFEPGQITLPSFPKAVINWNQLDNAVLKDGLLTIDFTNNRLLQGEILNNSGDVNEQEFNDFCSVQIKK